MALSGLDIFKLLPKTNCKKCGMPTCLAFAMALAQKKANLDQCPDASDATREALAASAAPPMRTVAFGAGSAEVKVGGETVLYRHEEKFHRPTAVAVTLPDDLDEAARSERIEAIKCLTFERVGERLSVDAVAVTGGADPARFAAAAEAAAGSGLAVILMSESPDAVEAALQKIGPARPLVWGAMAANADRMAELAKSAKCPLVAVSAGEDLEHVAALTERLKAAGCDDLVLDLDAADAWATMASLVRARELALKKNFRPLGYPTLAKALDGTSEEQAMAASALVCKYTGIVVVGTAEPWAILPILTARQNIFTDPQKPVQVEAKLYSVGDPGPDSPVLFTTNFSLTYYTVEGDVEAARAPAWILVVDTEGTSVLTAYSGDKLSEKTVAKAIKDANLESVVTHRRLIIPGYVAVMSGALEEETGWEILVGPRESSFIPRYLQQVWK